MTASPWPRRIAVVGAAGLVGSGVAYHLAMAGIGDEVLLVDPRRGPAQSHVIDITEAQALEGLSTPRLVVPEDAMAAGPVDLVVLAASAPETPGGDRHDFLAANVALLTSLTPLISALAGERSLVLVLSNPVDVMAGCLHRIAGIAPERILGYSVNDSVRFRLAVARELGVDVGRVDGVVLGEHGAGQVPAFTSVRLDGAPVELDEPARERVRAEIDGWFARWSALEPGRSSGWTTALGVRHLVQGLAAGDELPGAAWTGDVGLEPATFLALPTRLTDGVVEARLPHLDADERRRLEESASSIDALTRSALERG